MKLDRVIRPNIASLKPYTSARDEYGGEVKVKLDANENCLGDEYAWYPDPSCADLRAKYAELKGLDQSQVLAGNGSDEILDLVFRTFCVPGKDNIIVLPPTYGMYKVLADINDIACREAVLNEDFSLNVERVLEQIDQYTKAIFICSPNNPTGNTLDTGKIEQLLDQFEGLLVIDEAYIDFSSNESWTKRLDEYPQLIIVQTLSKYYAAASLRVGFALASAEIIGVLSSVKPPYNINALSQVKALEVLNKTVEISRQNNQIIKERQNLENALKDLEAVEFVYPSEANFLLVKVKDAEALYKALLEDGIVVRNRSNQYACQNCLRITVGTAQQNQQIVNTIKEFSNEESIVY